ncbi:hypothetical protein [Marinimicrobium sp. ABcell2]|uniref:hypothetical protein n=1 Tax=Marinimicrobium sp. ABcell2 TaxID=3069751 RepID=UPI0027B15C2D|nr:hypothetical protein [Marinimicrobium sp. ABcell2]MDQ2077462.1 hypothetical protein [Marinimicrobium sp. ABcell2]
MRDWILWSPEQQAFLILGGFATDRNLARIFTAVQVRELCSSAGRNLVPMPVADSPVLESLTAWVEAKMAKTLKHLKCAHTSEPASPNDYFARIVHSGLAPWLEQLRGSEFDERDAQCIAEIYFVYAERYASELPSILASLERHYDISVPVVEGILSMSYWKQYFTDTVSQAA